jgi:hypothetical protein
MSFAYCALLDNKNQLLTQNKQQSQSSSTEQVSSTREGEGDKLSLRLVRHAYARHHSKNRQADTYYLAVDTWRRHISPDEGIVDLDSKFPVLLSLYAVISVLV